MIEHHSVDGVFLFQKSCYSRELCFLSATVGKEHAVDTSQKSNKNRISKYLYTPFPRTKAFAYYLCLYYTTIGRLVKNNTV